MTVRTEMSPALSLAPRAAPKPPPAITCSLRISSQPSRALPLGQEADLWFGTDQTPTGLQYGLAPYLLPAYPTVLSAGWMFRNWWQMKE